MPNEQNRGDYSVYEVPDFICDPFFQDWIIHPDGEEAAFWEDWLGKHPEKKETIDLARSLLKSMYFTEQFPSDAAIETSLAMVREKMAAGGTEDDQVIPIHSRNGGSGRSNGTRRTWWAAAAAVMLIAGAYWLTRNTHREQQVSTRYAETKSLYLPDSSRLILNAHSDIRYSRDWQSGKDRELWLNGEAYFDVRSKAASTFRVYVKDLTVEVLGTSFDIRNRRGRTEIVLEKGKIKVIFPRGSHEDLVMAPGNKLIYDEAKAVLTRTETVPQNYTLWKDHKLTDATAAEIIDYLEDNYNKTIVLDDETLARRKIGGVILLDNFDDALFALSTVLNVTVTKHQDTLFLQHK